jgi:hypothetical protein
VRTDRIRSHQLFRDESREAGLDAAFDVDVRELLQLGARVRFERSRFDREVRLLGVTLTTHRDVLADGHRAGARDDRSNPGDEDVGAGPAGGRDADHKCGSGEDAVVGAEDGGPQPRGAQAPVVFGANGVHHGPQGTLRALSSSCS